MPRGDKSKYTDKQKRQAEHIAESYVDEGLDEKEAKSRAWATVNKFHGGGNKSGSGRRKMKKGGTVKKENRTSSTESARHSRTAKKLSAKKLSAKKLSAKKVSAKKVARRGSTAKKS